MKPLVLATLLVFLTLSAYALGTNAHLSIACEGVNSKQAAFLKGYVDIRPLTSIGPINVTGLVSAAIAGEADGVKGDRLELKSIVWKVSRGMWIKFRSDARMMGFQKLFIANDLYSSRNQLVFKGRTYKMRCMATESQPEP